MVRVNRSERETRGTLGDDQLFIGGNDEGLGAVVITSYSIHYTKLYDKTSILRLAHATIINIHSKKLKTDAIKYFNSILPLTINKRSLIRNNDNIKINTNLALDIS